MIIVQYKIGAAHYEKLGISLKRAQNTGVMHMQIVITIITSSGKVAKKFKYWVQ